MKLKLPNVEEQSTEQTNIILEMNANIKEILSEILKMQSEYITDKNEEEIKEIIGKADLIITECHSTKKFHIQKNDKFNRLVYEYQRLNLKYESYKINNQMKNVDAEYNEIKRDQEKIKSESNNLVYNILGFIASFSIVSAAVAAISNIKDTSNIMLFMAFCAFILITTLIGLNNFYKKDVRTKNPLQNNYFLWWSLLVVIILLIGYNGIKYIKNNQQIIFEAIGRGIAAYQEENK